MRVLFSLRKDGINRREHGISLQSAEHFDLDSALVIEDDSQAYGETRFIATGFLNSILHVLVFTQVDDNTIRATSLRKAVPSERVAYAKHQEKPPRP